MGRVVVCHGSLGAAQGEVRAMLEGDAIQLRGDIRANLPVAGLKRLRVEDDQLLALAEGGPLALQLGAKEAALWVRKIENPPTLADKLGVSAGTPVHAHEQHAEIARVMKAAGAQLVPLAKAQLVFLMIDSPARLETLKLLAGTRPAGAQLWIVRPKGKDAPVRESDIMTTAREAGLSPSKTASWSDTFSADRYGASK
jgi:hypothetical protein